MSYVSYAYTSVSAFNDQCDKHSFAYVKLGYQPEYVGFQDIKRSQSFESILYMTNGSLHAYDPKYLLNLFGFNLSIGKYFDNDVRIDLEFAHNHNLVLDNRVRSANIFSYKSMLFLNSGFNVGVVTTNFYFDTDVIKLNINELDLLDFTLYIGCGFGFGRVDFNAYMMHKFSSDTSPKYYISYPLALQFKAGLQTHNDRLPFSFYIGYKLVYLSDYTLTNISYAITSKRLNDNFSTSSIIYMLHNIDIGVIHTF